MMRYLLSLFLAWCLLACIHKPVVVPQPDMATLQEMAVLEDSKRAAIQQMDAAYAERDVLATKIKTYLALHCKCKHKAVLQ
jgi:hypothetical protein